MIISNSNDNNMQSNERNNLKIDNNDNEDRQINDNEMSHLSTITTFHDHNNEKMKMTNTIMMRIIAIKTL